MKYVLSLMLICLATSQSFANGRCHYSTSNGAEQVQYGYIKPFLLTLGGTFPDEFGYVAANDETQHHVSTLPLTTKYKVEKLELLSETVEPCEFNNKSTFRTYAALLSIEASLPIFLNAQLNQMINTTTKWAICNEHAIQKCQE